MDDKFHLKFALGGTDAGIDLKHSYSSFLPPPGPLSPMPSPSSNISSLLQLTTQLLTAFKFSPSLAPQIVCSFKTCLSYIHASS